MKTREGLGRIPVKTGPADKPVEMYVYRGEVANNARFRGAG